MEDITLFETTNKAPDAITINGSPISLTQYIPSAALNIHNENISTIDNIICANVGVNRVVAIPGEIREARHHKFETVQLRQNRGPLIIYDKRWYFRLVQAKQGEYGRARSLMDDYNLNQISHHMVVCFTPDTIPGSTTPFRNRDGKLIRIYAFFDSYLEFFEYMMKFDSVDRAFYEIIFGELPQKPHFDIDIALSELNKVYPGEDINIVAKNIKDSVIRGCIEVLNDHSVQVDISRDILLYSSHGDEKRSFHLIINNKCHDGNKEAKAFYDAVIVKVRTYTQNKYIDFIDKGVYSPRQQFRLVGCQKCDSNRPKIFHELFSYQGSEYTHVYNEDVTDITMKKLTMIYESMASFTSGCTYLPLLIPPKAVNYYNNEDLPDINGNLVDQCMHMLRESMSTIRFTIRDRYGNEKVVTPTCPYSVREVVGHTISLKRDAPSLCPMCKKSEPHQLENPYMFILGGKVYWDCRRAAADTKKFFVGYIAVSIGELQNGITLTGASQEEDIEIDEGGEFMFGDYNIGEPTLPPLIKVDAGKQSPHKQHLPDVTNGITTTATVSQTLIPIDKITPIELRKETTESINKIAIDHAKKNYIKHEDEDLTNVRSIASTIQHIKWDSLNPPSDVKDPMGITCTAGDPVGTGPPGAQMLINNLQSHI